MSDIYQQINFKLDMRNTHAKGKPQTKGKPKGRFFRSVRLYLTDIMIDICHKWRIFLAQNGEKEGFCIGNDIQVVPKKMQ